MRAPLSWILHLMQEYFAGRSLWETEALRSSGYGRFDTNALAASGLAEIWWLWR
jgi:hypothetical protein